MIGKLLVSQPHIISNIRLVKPNPKRLSTDFFDKIIENRQTWTLKNHQFWLENNLNFNAQKHEFLCKNDSKKLELFYQKYLLENESNFKEYNKQLWIGNILNLKFELLEYLKIIFLGLSTPFHYLNTVFNTVSCKFNSHVVVSERLRIIIVWFLLGITTPIIIIK
jgi:hypothetical protein